MSLTPVERSALMRIYRFQKKRRFRYGLNVRYVGVSERVLNALRDKGLVWFLRPYRGKSHTYVFLTKKGRQFVEEELLMNYR